MKRRLNTALASQLAIAFRRPLLPSRRICKKQGYPSKGAAEAGLRSLVKRGLHRPEEGTIHAYQCPRCLQWHTGHALKEE